MKIGTKSILFGAHQFAIHPWFVAEAWYRLYGYPWALWLWIAFFVHDIGYWGKPNMDGPEGEEHPWTGAKILYALQGWWLFWTRNLWEWEIGAKWRVPIRWWEVRRKMAHSHLEIVHEEVIWGNEVLYHSRFLAKRYNAKPSRFCIADKLAIVLTPRWLYLPLVRMTGEVKEYMNKSESRNGAKYSGMNLDTKNIRVWYDSMIAYMTRWIAEHKDGREDTWTPVLGVDLGSPESNRSAEVRI